MQVIAIVISVISLLFGGGILTAIIKYLSARIKANDKKTDAVCFGVQALLRDRLYATFKENSKKGYATISEKENFENMYNQYHSLGANGVMDEIHEKFKNLPIK